TPMTGGRVHESLSSPGPLACSLLGGALVGVPAQRRTGRGQSWRRGRGPSKAGRRLRPQPSCTGTTMFTVGRVEVLSVRVPPVQVRRRTGQMSGSDKAASAARTGAETT